MAPDELTTPLGQKKQKKLPKLFTLGPQLLVGLLGFVCFVAAIWAMLANDPLGGEPVAIVPTMKLTPAQPEPETGVRTSAAATQAAPKTEPQKKALAPAESKTVTIIDGSSGKSQNVIIPGDAANGKLANSSQGILESTRHGLIPKIGPNGERAVLAYAHPIQLPNGTDLPKIAIIVGGLGISATGTNEAFKLPATITFAATPYNENLQSLAARVGATKHELLLQVPMEPFDYPDNDPGPQTLLTTLSAEQNVDRLQWLMSRMQGYVGIMSYMGAHFTASDKALRPILSEVGKRGLLYVDDGSSSRSVSGQVAGSSNLPFTKADVVIDALPNAVEIDRALARLELIAREKGSAVGIANAESSVVAHIADWIKTVESRGYILVPITMIAARAKSS